MIGIFGGLIRPIVSNVSPFGFSSVFTRSLMKSHKGAAKRWRKTANGFKRRQAARNHGNTGWSLRVLSSGSSTRLSNPAQTKRLKKLLPYA